MQLLDTFLYNGEKDMLLMRLIIYNDYVDKFIIIEGNKTFTNLPKKKLYIDEIKSDERFNVFLDKIEFIVCSIESDNPWENERKSRSEIIKSDIFKSCPNDSIILHSDCDEILREKTLIEIKNKKIIGKTFLFRNIMFSLKWEYPNLVYTSITLSKEQILIDNDLQKLRLEFRNNPENHYHEEIGWHFSFVQPIEDIIRKISSFSHQEMNRKEYNNEDYIKNEIIEKGNCIDFFTCDWNKGNVPQLKLNNIQDLPDCACLIDYFDILKNSKISECGQDQFALIINKFKENGSFLEIGSHDPYKFGSNCFMLDYYYKWKGISVDITYYKYYDIFRKNTIYLNEDAITLDYDKILLSLPSIIDYLSFDLDVISGSTINTLENLKNIFNKYKFNVITFEHDIYTGDYFNTRKRSREIFNQNNYELIFSDVTTRGVKSDHDKFEDWYISKDLINIINKIKSSMPNRDGLDGSYIVSVIAKLL